MGKKTYSKPESPTKNRPPPKLPPPGPEAFLKLPLGNLK